MLCYAIMDGLGLGFALAGVLGSVYFTNAL